MSPKDAVESGAGTNAARTVGEPAVIGSDWADQVTDLVVDSVDKVRDKTTGPILEYSSLSVHLMVALMVFLPVAVIAVLGLVRLLTWAVGRAWLSYSITGVLLILIGAVLWSRRSKLPI